MFDVGWSEILIVAGVALVVVGPKDLPVLMRTIGRYAGMAKRQVDTFRAELNVVMREADLDLVRKEMEAIKQSAGQEVSAASKALDQADDAARKSVS
ncbi:Sec-independent protein translocase protein TatB [Hyphomicrobium sp.]|uniref:Sec-independent protein translocase protein TatB n=1 Tax=Hyphomicrobium sp. TaxID=82 RepID=UPI002FDD652C